MKSYPNCKHPCQSYQWNSYQSSFDIVLLGLHRRFVFTSSSAEIDKTRFHAFQENNRRLEIFHGPEKARFWSSLSFDLRENSAFRWHWKKNIRLLFRVASISRNVTFKLKSCTTWRHISCSKKGHLTLREKKNWSTVAS